MKLPPIFDQREPALRLELIRILMPLAVLGFMASRMLHAEEWLGTAGFHVPELGREDYRQPLYLPPLSGLAPWLVVGLMALSGLALSAGFRTRAAAWAFAATVAYVALADRLSAFTVSKLAPALAVALALSEAGAHLGLDARRAIQGTPAGKAGARGRISLAVLRSNGAIRFFQLLLMVFYSGSGICKLRGDWLSRNDVLWSHLHDSYQTSFSWLLANRLPSFSWALLQWVVLVLEVGAPLWFTLRQTRTVALLAAVGMHAVIGLSFGPVRWFSLLMISLLLGSFLPARWLRGSLDLQGEAPLGGADRGRGIGHL